MEEIRYYGCWAGNEKGYPEDKIRCAEKVWPKDQYHSAQCSRKRIVGIFCRQHAKLYGQKEVQK